MSASSARSEIFIEKSLPLSFSSSVRGGIDFRFAMSLTELEESKGSLSCKYFTPSGAGGISDLPIQDGFSTRCIIWVRSLHR
jgi:hypothetical protein